MKKPPDNIEQLARELKLSGAQLEGLEAKHGGNLLRVLQKVWRGRQEKRRLLHRDSSRGYTDEPALAMPNEPEAVDEDEQRRITAEAHAREHEAHELASLEREQRILTERLAGVRADSAERKVDLSKDERVIQRRLQAIDKVFRAA